MRSLSRSTFIWLALLAALFVLAVAAPLAAAAGPELRAAPLSAEFLRYQADFKLRHTLGLDRVPGFRPGLVPAPMDVSYLKGARSAPPMATYATSYDLRTLNRVSPVKDQDPYSTCWTFAALGSLESCLLPGETSDFSEDNMVLTSGFNFPGTLYDAGGNYLMSTAYLVRWGGPVNETEDAYGDNLTPPGLTSRKHVQEVNWIPPRGSALDNDNIKSALTQYGGAYVSMGWYGSSGGSSYYSATTSSYYYNGNSGSNHAVLIVGWDDNYSAANFATTPAGNGAFIVKNSWGATWGSNGYFYVSYYDSELGRGNDLSAVFDNAESTSNYGGIYQYDPLGDGTELGYSSSTGWFANVFTADSTASLGAVGFYTAAPGTIYEVYTGSSLATKTLRTSGTLAYMGYHTVTLPSLVTVTSGQQFVVAVKMTSPGYSYPIAIEKPIAGYSTAATATAGQSYVSSTGSNWTDLTTKYANTNVCLKAYVKTYVPQPPAITGFTPTSGRVGTTVTVTGTDFTGATTVTFNGAAATFNVATAEQLTATVPVGAASGPIAVTTPIGTGTSTASFTVTAPAPTVTSFWPTSGRAGTAVTVTGTDFFGATAVTFNGTAATFSVASATQLTATVPARATSGPLFVTTPAGTGKSAARFTVTAPAKPRIATLKPAAARRGALVTINGSGFGAKGSGCAVRFGATKATKYISWSVTKIKCRVPAKAHFGKVRVAVRTPAGTSNAKNFTVKR